jgi:capsular polysaccharide biosynthesis protein
VKDKDRPVLPALNRDDDLPERLWAYDDFLAEEDPPVSDFSAGLVSLGYLKAGLRRSARLWCATAALGFVCGLGLAVAAPPAYQATTTVLLTHNSSQDPTDAVSTDISLAGSHTVADRAMAKLGLTGNAGAFVAAESVSAITNRVLQITVSAPSSAQAVARAQALATEFLAFRAEQLQDQQQLVGNGLDQQVNQAKAQLAAINQQISQLSGQSGSAAKLTQLNTQKTDAANNLDALQQTVASNQASGEAQVLSQIKGSQVLDAAAPVHHSVLKTDLIYALIGLVVGLVAGLAFVIVRSLITDRLRRRDDIADALGAPITVSAGPVRRRRWWPSRARTRARRAADLQRLAASLRSTLPAPSSGPAALALVAVDNQAEAAQVLVTLATSAAHDGQSVLIADLSPGTPVARLLGTAGPGVHQAETDGIQLTVAVPEEASLLPAGPRGPVRPAGRPPSRPAGQPSSRANGSSSYRPDRRTGLLPSGADADGADTLRTAYQRADLMLTLVALDPSLGAAGLPTWAPSAAVVVTAGRSTWLRLNAVSELIRLSGTTLDAAVLIGADQSDESLGRSHTVPPRGPLSSPAPVAAPAAPRGL